MGGAGLTFEMGGAGLTFEMGGAGLTPFQVGEFCVWSGYACYCSIFVEEAQLCIFPFRAHSQMF